MLLLVEKHLSKTPYGKQDLCALLEVTEQQLEEVLGSGQLSKNLMK